MHNVPRPVAWAAELTVFNAVAGFMYGLLWPDLADRSSVVVVGAVLSLLMLGGAYVLWRARGGAARPSSR